MMVSISLTHNSLPKLICMMILGVVGSVIFSLNVYDHVSPTSQDNMHYQTHGRNSEIVCCFKPVLHGLIPPSVFYSALFMAHVENCAPPHEWKCYCGMPVLVRCQSCGPYSHFCHQCAVKNHQYMNIYHLLEVWKVWL